MFELCLVIKQIIFFNKTNGQTSLKKSTTTTKREQMKYMLRICNVPFEISIIASRVAAASAFVVQRCH
jgi:hypothetical protein